jgi:ElaB/YqjD/DUF883 family membrane-anchored ribosome-binding protein
MSNEDSNTYSSITDLDNLKKYIEEVFVSLSNLTDSKLRQMDEKIELLEKQIATLVVGFGEQAVFLEALLAQISFAEEDQQRAFQKNVNDARKEMLKVMQDGSRVVAQQDERLASAIEDVVESKSFDL